MIACSQENSGKKPGEKQTNETTGTVNENREASDESGSLDLPSKFRLMLRKEMVKIETGMQTLLSHLVRGQKKEAASIAKQIHESYILKRELSKKELKELKSHLPDAFVQLDQTFHKNAKKL